jgi:hypothetical protein
MMMIQFGQHMTHLVNSPLREKPDQALAYIGSLFPDRWSDGVYPFQPGADLWRAGLVFSFSIKTRNINDKPEAKNVTWYLHAGPEAKVVWEGTF